MDVETALRRMPKAELHLHLEGAVDVGTFAELAASHDLQLPAHEQVADLYQYDSLADFLVVYSLVCRSIQTEADFRRVTHECLERCADSGARYVELFFSPESHFEMGVDYPTMLAGVLAGMADAKAGRGLESSLIPAINRELGPQRAVEFVEMVAAHPHPQVVGVGLDFNEVGFPSADYVDAFRAAADCGLHRTSHAGEVGPADNVRAAIDLLACERIDHGYHVIDDPELLQRCAHSQIAFTVCPTTTTYTTVWRDLRSSDHAIARMAEAGLKLTVNSDDPAMFNSNLGDEYVRLHRESGFSVDALAEMALNSIDASWLDDSAKAALRAEWSAEIDALLASVDA